MFRSKFYFQVKFHYLEPVTVKLQHTSLGWILPVKEPVLCPTTSDTFTSHSPFSNYIGIGNICQHQRINHDLQTIHFAITEVGDLGSRPHSLHLLVLSHCHLWVGRLNYFYRHFFNLLLNHISNLQHKNRRLHEGFHMRLTLIPTFPLIAYL